MQRNVEKLKCFGKCRGFKPNLLFFVENKNFSWVTCDKRLSFIRY